MSIIDKATAQAAAVVIRDEDTEGANTAARVGGLLKDIADSVPFPQGVLTAAGLSGAYNNYNVSPIQTAYALRFGTDTEANFSGIAQQGPGAVRLVLNVGTTGTINLLHESSLSDAANRFKLPGAKDVALTPGASVILWYDANAARWTIANLEVQDVPTLASVLARGNDTNGHDIILRDSVIRGAEGGEVEGGDVHLVGGEAFDAAGGNIILTPGTGTTSGLIKFEGDVDGNGYLISNILDPIDPQDAATKVYVDAALGPPLTAVRYVDAASAASTPDGSMHAPFATVAAAVAALPSGGGVLRLAPGDYSAEPPLSIVSANVAFVALSPEKNVVLPAIEGSGYPVPARVWLESCVLLSASVCELYAHRSRISGSLTGLLALVVTDSEVVNDSTFELTQGSATFFGSSIESALFVTISGGGFVRVHNCTTDAGGPAGAVTFVDGGQLRVDAAFDYFWTGSLTGGTKVVEDAVGSVGGADLGTVLGVGNRTDGTDIVVSDGGKIVADAAMADLGIGYEAPSSGTGGSTTIAAQDGDTGGGAVSLLAGAATGNGDGGDVLIRPGAFAGDGSGGVIRLQGLVSAANNPVQDVAAPVNPDDAATKAYVDAGVGGASPSTAEYLVGKSDGGLPAERVVTGTTSVTWDLSTAGQAKAKRAALTGDVTAAADSNATTIANDAVTYAKLQNVSETDRLLGRDTAGAGDAEELTVGGGVEFTGSGGIQRSALSGDVTASAGSGATTIANDAVTTAKILNANVTNAKLANVATGVIKGRVSASLGAVEDLTGTQATTLLDAFTSSLKGLAPASGGGTTNFLRADGTWATISRTLGQVLATGNTTGTSDIQISTNGGSYGNSFAGTSRLKFEPPSDVVTGNTPFIGMGTGASYPALIIDAGGYQLKFSSSRFDFGSGKLQSVGTPTVSDDAATKGYVDSALTPLTLAVNTDARFGDGSDGDLTISAGTTTLTRDTYYNNLTISGTAQLSTSGKRLFVKGTLDLSAAPANAIHNIGPVGGNAAADVGGALANGRGNYSLGGSSNSTAGASGGTGAGAQASSPATANLAAGGGGGAGGSANGGATAGGAFKAGTTVAVPGAWSYPTYEMLIGAALVNHGIGGTGGSAGAGDGANKGGGGGGGGGAAGALMIYAKRIVRGGGTAAGCISTAGSAGGNGGNAGAGTAGGGGGGGGGGGAQLYIAYQTLSGSTATNALTASGGAGGNGGNGVSTGMGGTGGTGGTGGRIYIWPVSGDPATSVIGTAGSAGSGPTGTAGGAGGAGGACTSSL